MDIHRSELALLVALDALLEECNVTAAAKRLGISQPALSTQLGKLRALFDDALLVPDRGKMVPTPRAEALRERLRTALGQLNALVTEDATFNPAKAERSFVLAATDLAAATLLPPLLALIAKEAPGLTVAVVILDPGAIDEQMTRNGIDFAVVTEATAPDGWPARRLFEDDFRMIRREDHPEAKRKLTLDRFCAAEHLLVSPSGGSFHGIVDDALAELGRERRVVASLPTFLLAPSIVRVSDCVAVIPTRLAGLDRFGLELAQPPIAIPKFSLYLTWHPRFRADPGHRWMRDRIVAVAEV